MPLGYNGVLEYNENGAVAMYAPLLTRVPAALAVALLQPLHPLTIAAGGREGRRHTLTTHTRHFRYVARQGDTDCNVWPIRVPSVPVGHF